MKNAQARRKLIISRSTIELMEFTHWPRSNYFRLSEEEKQARENLKNLYRSESDISEYDNKLLLSKNSMYRSRTTLKRIIDSNAWAYKTENGKLIPPKFLTLTFAENVVDITQANYDHMKFVQRFNYELFGAKNSLLKYASVPEFQKRGAVHYHDIYFNMPYIERVYDVIGRIWGKGYFRLLTIKDLKGVKSVGDYIAKYITKNFDETRLWGRKRYFASRNLIRPLVVRDDPRIELILYAIYEAHKEIEFGDPKIIPTDFCGDITYRKFQLERTKSIFDLPLDENTRNYLKSLQQP